MWYFYIPFLENSFPKKCFWNQIFKTNSKIPKFVTEKLHVGKNTKTKDIHVINHFKFNVNVSLTLLFFVPSSVHSLNIIRVSRCPIFVMLMSSNTPNWMKQYGHVSRLLLSRIYHFNFTVVVSGPEGIKLFFMLSWEWNLFCLKKLNTSNLNFLPAQQNWTWNFSC